MGIGLQLTQGIIVCLFVCTCLQPSVSDAVGASLSLKPSISIGFQKGTATENAGSDKAVDKGKHEANIDFSLSLKPSIGKLFEEGTATESDGSDKAADQACTGGQVFTQCGSPCTPTCLKRKMFCPRRCVPRCECPRNRHLWHMGRCVSRRECFMLPGRGRSHQTE